MLATLREMMDAARDLPELREMIRSAYPKLDSGGVAALLEAALNAAFAAGISDVEDEAGG